MSHFTWRLEESYLKQTRFMRFLMVGVINTLLGLSVIFLFMNILDQSYWLSTFLGNTTGMICSYLLNRSLTFKSKVSLWKGGLNFFLASGITYVFSYWLAEKLVIVISGQFIGELAVLLGMVFYTISNYLVQKYVVFQNRVVT